MPTLQEPLLTADAIRIPAPNAMAVAAAMSAVVYPGTTTGTP
jgi:hypothetical protein